MYPPYAIVGGNPAKLIRYRIADANDRFNMQKISWWDWPEHVISERLDKIMSKDISAFIAEYLPKMTRLNIVSIYLVDESLTEVLVRVLRM